jgi:hypothetical protein
LGKFKAQYTGLLDALAPTKARMVLISPLPFPESFRLGDNHKLYTAAIETIATERKLPFANLSLFPTIRTESSKAEAYLLEPGQRHYNARGYAQTAPGFVTELGGPWNAKAYNESKANGAYDKLRRAVLAKNELFFHQWRPQNETYLFGFRKHEQGNNAKDVKEFEKLVDKADQDILSMKKLLFK